jgi:hypothetical protein
VRVSSGTKDARHQIISVVATFLPVHRTNFDFLNLFLSVPTPQNRGIRDEVKFSLYSNLSISLARDRI